MKNFETQYLDYYKNIKSRNKFRFYKGLFARLWNHVKAEGIRNVARIKGAKIGKNSYIPLKLALKANKNLIVGYSTIIETHKIDLRDVVTVGNHVIINKGVTIVRASHDLDSIKFETISSALWLKDYSWIATNATLLPGCKIVEVGSVIGAESVLGKSVQQPNSIYLGNPAVLKRFRKNVHSNLIVESLQGRDFRKYLLAGCYEE